MSADFILAREKITELSDYNVLISEFENGAEQRRLKHSNPIIGWKIESPALTYTQMTAYRSFLITKFGSLTAFTFLNPMDNTEHLVRFVPGSFEVTHESGYFKCKFEFKRVVA
ncbi:MAG: hypothetical protein EOM12_03780 [Verrucomicrobiae bacterium]|nr:hypothetical protein [Verrucomicrobiae bacterium]